MSPNAQELSSAYNILKLNIEPKFDGLPPSMGVAHTSYMSWSTDMSLHLKVYKLYDIVFDQNINSDGYEDKNTLVLLAFTKNLSASLGRLVANEKHAADAWNLLRDRFGKVDSSLGLRYKKELYMLKQGEKLLFDYIQENQRITDLIVESGGKLDKQERNALFLEGLNKKFYNFV